MSDDISKRVLNNLSRYDHRLVDMYHWKQCRDIYNRLLLGVVGGLCNRLISMWWWNQWCKQHNRGLSVLWKVCPACPGELSDVFTSQCMSDVHRYQTDYWIANVCDVDWSPSSDEYPHNAWPVPKNEWPVGEQLIDIVALQPVIKERVQHIINTSTRDYVAVHVRRTDHVESAKKHGQHVTDEQYEQWLDSCGSQAVYVATDNKHTFDHFHARYGPRMCQREYAQLPLISDDPAGRHTSLEQAVVDMMMCVLAERFMGNNWSTFTYLINQMRTTRDHWIDHVFETDK